jgi:hypothetical protein
MAEINEPRLRRKMRADALALYAELRPKGKPKTCSHADWKVIFADQANADACAEALRRCGSDPMRSYQCPKSKSGHWHLTTAHVREVA